ncbi:hypothetical protein ABT072_19470 [Streptomyces sp. NPDC002589]|uniref:hypothetical protein n=1 Tax=Streptomyces sp. NPDC002589 TaxID=3154420 RepID=UPI003330A4C9
MSDDQQSPTTFASGVRAARFGERPYRAGHVHEQPAALQLCEPQPQFMSASRG